MTSRLAADKLGMMPRLLKRGQAAAYLGVSVRTFIALCPVRAVALGNGNRLERYDIHSLDEWIDTLGGERASCDRDWLAALDAKHGVKRYRSKGRWYAYHRKSGLRLKSEFGTGEFFAELAAIERKLKSHAALPGTLGLLLSSYRASPRYTDLATSTRQGYARMMNLLHPIHDMPLFELTPQFIAGLRDRMTEKHGRRLATTF
jgi:hypothetical protein